MFSVKLKQFRICLLDSIKCLITFTYLCPYQTPFCILNTQISKYALYFPTHIPNDRVSIYMRKAITMKILFRFYKLLVYKLFISLHKLLLHLKITKVICIRKKKCEHLAQYLTWDKSSRYIFFLILCNELNYDGLIFIMFYMLLNNTLM